MKKLLILGNKTLAVEIADLASEIQEYNVAGYVENMDPDRCRFVYGLRYNKGFISHPENHSSSR